MYELVMKVSYNSVSFRFDDASELDAFVRNALKHYDVENSEDKLEMHVVINVAGAAGSTEEKEG